MKRLTQRQRDDLKQRWAGNIQDITQSSPFGRTEEGQWDFRGCDLSQEIFEGIHLDKIDFSYSDLSNIRFIKGIISNCNFYSCSMFYSFFRESRISNCVFDRADMRWIHIRLPSVSISDCSFKQSRVDHIDCKGVIFKDIEFDGKFWKKIDFYDCKFMDCSFRNELYALRFRGRASLDEKERDLSPPSPNLDHVDFSKSKFRYTDMGGGCTFVDIKLPEDGHVLIDSVSNINNLPNSNLFSAQEIDIIIPYIEITGGDSLYQPYQFVSLRDIEGYGSPDVAAELYCKWKMNTKQV